jgi:hypothetical protein
MPHEDVAQRGDDRGRRRRHQQRRDRAVLEPEPRGDCERHAVLRPLRRGQQNLLLDPDVAEQALAECGVRRGLDHVRARRRFVEQARQPVMIGDQQPMEGAGDEARGFGHRGSIASCTSRS